MKIAFNEISGSEVSYKIVDNGWFPHNDVTVAEPVNASVTIRRSSEAEVILTGEMTGKARTVCARCGKPVEVDLASEFRYECIVGKDDPCMVQEMECREEDFTKIYLKESVINIGDILREQVFLAIPISVLCQQSCKGLCSQCGADLNSGSCTCDSVQVSSQFALLQKVKGR